MIQLHRKTCSNQTGENLEFIYCMFFMFPKIKTTKKHNPWFAKCCSMLLVTVCLAENAI